MALIVLAVLGAALTGRRMAAVGRALAAEQGALSSSLSQRLHSPLLLLSIQTRVAIAVGIVFLMTTKPDLIGSLAAIGASAIIGLASAAPAH